MKKLLLVFSLIFISLICLGQNKKGAIQYKANSIKSYYVPHPDTLNLINITHNQKFNGWGLMGTTCAGCASYYYKIFRSKNPFIAEDDMFYYYYYFYFYSNSHLPNGDLAGTYLSDVNFFINENYVFDVEYILLDIGQIVYGAWARSTNPKSLILIKPTKVTVY